MRIEGNLPEDLWPEVFKLAVYITNRTPSKALNGKTPHEKMNQSLGKPNAKSNIAHIKVYGCKVYKRVTKISKKRKMVSRPKVEYLVGYQAIVRSIKISKSGFCRNEKYIVESRDVDFDENSKYDPNTPLPEVETTPLQ